MLRLMLVASALFWVSCERNEVSSQGSMNDRVECAEFPQEAFMLLYRYLRQAHADGVWSLLTEAARQECAEGYQVSRSVRDEGMVSRASGPGPRSPKEYCAYIGVRGETEHSGPLEFPTPEIVLVKYAGPDRAVIRDEHTEQSFERIQGCWKIRKVSVAADNSSKLRTPIKVQLPDGTSGPGDARTR